MSGIVIPRTLKDHLKRGLCIPWCGAGLSMPAGLPSWDNLVRQMIEVSREHGLGEPEYEELVSLYQARFYDDVIDYCRQTLGEGEYRQFLDDTFGSGIAHSYLHEEVASLDVPAIFTTNYDRLLEAALIKRGVSLPTVLTSHDTTTLWRRTARDEFFILKVHGDITRPDTVVLSSKDYTEHVFGNLAFMQYLQRVLLSKSFLFIGTSLNDVYVRRILEESAFLTRGVGMPHFAVLANTGAIRSKLLRERFNIHVITFDSVASKGGFESAMREVFAKLKA
jgi:SIR2-like domain